MKFIIDSYKMNPQGMTWDQPSITIRTIENNLTKTSKTDNNNPLDNDDFFDIDNDD